MTTDRELLELAAKAAGYTLRFRDCDDGFPSIVEKEEGLWMPQDDDGDALRLAVNAQISIEFADDVDNAPIVIAGDRYNKVQECLAPDFKAKTRRAIVRAAAEIGRGME